jgi:Fe-S cluster assembly protein SufD
MNLSENSSTGFLASSSLLEHLANQYPADWLKPIRTNSARKYLEQPIPTRKTEHWKYNDLNFFVAEKYAAANSESIEQQLIAKIKLEVETSNFIVVINGKYHEDLSELEQQSVSITRFENTDEAQQNYVRRSLEQATQQKNLLVDLNQAISNDGLLIEIKEKAILKQPVYLLNLNTEVSTPSMSANQVIVHCGANSESQVIEHFANLANKPVDTLLKTEQAELEFHFALQQTVIDISTNAQCRHTRLNLEKPTSKQVSRVLNRLQKDSRLESFYFSRGSSLNKTDIDVWHEGTNSNSELTGIYLPSATNVIDYHTCIEHQVPHCNSREVFRGIIADESKATFSGKIHIFKDAQKSDAQLSNKNLLLTNKAEINTKPELEIYADDVVCAHGATIAKIDEKAIYYLQTRGIGEMKARKMLSIGFINELLIQIKNPALMDAVAKQLEVSLSELD